MRRVNWAWFAYQGSIANRTTPTLVNLSSSQKVWQVAAGGHHSLLFTARKKLIVFGANERGQLGLGDTQNRKVPTVNQSLSDIEVRCVSAGKDHSALIDISGKVFLWGSNKHGKLGVGSTASQMLAPQKVEVNPGLPVRVACGSQNTMILLDDGTVHVCGKNSARQVNPLDTRDANKFYPVEELEGAERIFCSNFFAVMTKELNLYVWGGSKLVENPRPTLIHELEQKVVDVGVGRDLLIVLDSNGLVFAAGANDQGQLGFGDTPFERSITCLERLCASRLKSVTCGRDFVIALGGFNVQGSGRFGSFIDRSSNASFDLKPSNLISVAPPRPLSPTQNGLAYHHEEEQGPMRGNDEPYVDSRSVHNTPHLRPDQFSIVQEYQKHICELLNEIKNKYPGIPNQVDPAVLDRLFEAENRLKDLYKEAPSTHTESRESATKRVESLAEEFEYATKGTEYEKGFFQSLSALRGGLRFDNSNLLFLIQCAKVNGDKITRCVEQIDTVLENADFSMLSLEDYNADI